MRDVRGSSKREALTRFIPDAARRPDRIDAVYDHFAPGSHSGTPRASAQYRALQKLSPPFAEGRPHRPHDRVRSRRPHPVARCPRLDAGCRRRRRLRRRRVRGPARAVLIHHAMELTGTYQVRSVATVGDTALDLQAGFNAGVGWNIGVLSGAHDRETLAAAPHTHLIASVAAPRERLATAVGLRDPAGAGFWFVPPLDPHAHTTKSRSVTSNAFVCSLLRRLPGTSSIRCGCSRRAGPSPLQRSPR